MTNVESLRSRIMSVVPTTGQGVLGALAVWMVAGFLLEFPSSLGLSLHALSHMLFWPIYIGLRLLKWAILIAIVVFVVRIVTHRPVRNN